MSRKSLSATLLVTAFFFALTSGGQSKDADGLVWPDPPGTASIIGGSASDPIAIRVSRRSAGAIDRLSWAGRQFVNDHDHGREFQSASYFDHKGACDNPTEAGSAADGTGPDSTSQLISLTASDHVLKTRTRMAYWIGPGGKAPECNGLLSTVVSPLSEDILEKTVEIGSYGLRDVVSYDVTFKVRQPHEYGVFEALTGYMSPAFRQFWTYDPERNSLERQSNQQGSQTLPLIVSTEDGAYALGVVSGSSQRAVYGRWDFTQSTMASPTIKWNCVYANNNVAAGDHHFLVFMVVGSLSRVQLEVRSLCEKLGADTCKAQ